MIEVNKIYNGESLSVLKTFPDNSINCVMTSPTYWSLRDYGVEGQLGLEPTFKEYIQKLCDIFDEVKRVLKKEGTCWINLGDVFASGTRDKGQVDLSRLNSKEAKNCKGWHIQPNRQLNNYPSKSLCLIPFRFAIEMQERGWILRNDIVWYKRNSMPTSVKDRFANKWEHVFFFVKNRKYFFDLDSVRKPYLASSINPINAGFSDHVAFNYRVREACKGTLQAKFGEMYSATDQEKAKYKGLSLEQAEALGSPRAREVRYNSKYPNQQLADKKEQRMNGTPHDLANCNPLGGNPGDFWDITTQGHPFAHFAVYPERLCEVPIKCGCPKDGIVLDPFIGSGTTALVALKQNKKFVGIELNPKYIEIAMTRLKPFLEQTKLVQ